MRNFSKIVVFLMLFIFTSIYLQAQYITVTSPNGGEEWLTDSTYDIMWKSYGTSGYVNIGYSLNDGLDWTEIIECTPDNSIYSWTIPDTSSASCLIGIWDTNGITSDTSNEIFNIFYAPFITVTSPNGEEVWLADNIYDITWKSTGTSGEVKIEYSLNNGQDWMEITACTPDNNSYPWTTPGTLSDSCLISISDTNGSLADKSNSVFAIDTIEAFIHVTTPNGGEKWKVDSIYKITWTSRHIYSNKVRIDYSTDSGKHWKHIHKNLPNTGSFSWKIPDNTSKYCLVRIYEANSAPQESGAFDISDGVFEIWKPNR